MRRRPLVLTVVCALALAFAPAASARQEVASAGDVTATFSYEHQNDPWGWRDLWLTITRAGQVLYDDAPTAGGCEEPNCFPGAGLDADADSIRVRDIDGDGEPEVLLDIFTGGAHCCLFARIFRFDGTTYHSIQHNFADPGYRLADLDHDGMPEFISADARFGYRYTSFASSLMPIRIYTYRGGVLLDNTDQFPDRVRADAKQSWRYYRKALRDNAYEPRGAIAAWAADRYLLGARKHTLRVLRRLARRGKLPGYPPRSQTRFVSKLDRDLRHLGYKP